MHYILLSGGSGKRLWPLSNEIRSKQFIKIFRRKNGEYESMIQRVYRQIREADPSADVTIATGKSQVSSLINQLGETIDLCKEPCRRDTFPAIALAAVYLRDRKQAGLNEGVVVLPVDPYVEAPYFRALKELGEQAEESASNLVLMGIEPTYPSEKYGYIIPEPIDAMHRDIGYASSSGETERKKEVQRVRKFKEKPDKITAESYIRNGALWNGGVFAFRRGWLLSKTRELTGYDSYDELLSNYEELPKTSFDYAVVEKETEIEVMRFSGTWKDLGTWNTLTETMDEAVIGNGQMNEACENVHILNERKAVRWEKRSSGTFFMRIKGLRSYTGFKELLPGRKWRRPP